MADDKETAGVCPKCKRGLKNTEGSITCDGTCGQTYHGNCLGLKNHQIKRLISLQPQIPYKCDSCLSKDDSETAVSRNTPTFDSPTNSQNQNFQPNNSEFNQLMAAIQGIKLDLNGQINEIKNTTSNLCTKFDKFEGELKKIAALEMNVKTIQQENTSLKCTITKLENKVSNLEMQSVATQLIIENIPMAHGEDLMKIYDKLATRVSAQNTKSDITDIKRLINRNIQPALAPNSRPPPILVQFLSVTSRNFVLSQRKAAGIIRSECCDPDDSNFGQLRNNSVYINPNYPPAVRSLFHEARSLKKSSKVKFVFVKSNKVYGKLDRDSDPFEIVDSHQIKGLLITHKNN
jgi:hypothetical protein